ncbi:MAG TPA: hypothetical protein VFD92_06610 [Candidatus Binatia bacterium]|nr:hypothetical protein [Candidatus Binatia bacterium]
MTAKDDCLEMLRGGAVDRDAFARAFESVPHDERVAITEAIDGAGQAKLWDAARGERVAIADMVPPDLGALRPVIFHGKNSLPVFTRFQKRFCRPAPGVERDELWGYNYQPVGWLAPLTGPGYFVAYDSGDAIGSVAVDYTRIPTGRPADWPEIHDNTFRLSRFIYNGMIDYLRRVSQHLLIGRATKAGKEMPNYFLLCREDPGR